jgi:hypothetical protein
MIVNYDRKTFIVQATGAIVTAPQGLLNKSLCLAAALGVTKFIMSLAMNLVTLCCAA